MITYLYWIFIFGLSILAFWAFGRLNKWRPALIGALAILIVGWLAYFFHFEQLFVKQYGGIMTISVPDGQMHISATWKENHLWVENYDPANNTCYFSEYSKGNLLQGRVVIKNCNPASFSRAPANNPSSPAPTIQQP